MSTLGTNYEEENTSSKLADAIDSFRKSENIQGEGWDTIQAELEKYSAAFKAYNTLFNSLSTAVNNYITTLKNILDNYTGSIKITSITNFERTITAVQDIIGKLEGKKLELDGELQAAYTYNRSITSGANMVTDSDSDPTPSTANYRSPSAIQADIDKVDELIRNYKLYSSTLESLQKVYNAAKEEFQTLIEAEYNTFATTVENVLF